MFDGDGGDKVLYAVSDAAITLTLWRRPRRVYTRNLVVCLNDISGSPDST
jgi:hypothetical protein